MSKNHLNNFFDYLFWFIVLVFPLVVVVFGNKLEFVGLDNLIDFTRSNFISSSIKSIFDLIEVDMPVFLYWYLSYMVFVYIAHLFVDFLAFIPRLGHSLMDKFYNVGGMK